MVTGPRLSTFFSDAETTADYCFAGCSSPLVNVLETLMQSFRSLLFFAIGVGGCSMPISEGESLFDFFGENGVALFIFV